MVNVGEHVHGTPGRLQTGLKSRIPIRDTFNMYSTDFSYNVSGSWAGNNWTGGIITGDWSVYTQNVDSGQMYATSDRYGGAISSMQTQAYRTLENYTDYPYEILLKFKTYITRDENSWSDQLNIQINCNNDEATGQGLLIDIQNQTISHRKASVVQGTVGVSMDLYAYKWAKIRVDKNKLSSKIWLDGANEPGYQLITPFTFDSTIYPYLRLYTYAYNNPGGTGTCQVYYDFFSITGVAE